MIKNVGAGVPVAVPEMIVGLTRILDHFDRFPSLASLHLPPAVLASLPGISPPVRSLPIPKKEEAKASSFFGAGDRDRTGTLFTARDFKSLVSACSTTPADVAVLIYLTVPNCASRVPVSVCGKRRMSLPTERLRPPPTAAHAAPLLHLPPAAQRLAARISRYAFYGEGF